MSKKCSLRYSISFLRIRGQRLEFEEGALKEYSCNDTPSYFSLGILALLASRLGRKCVNAMD